MKNLNNKVRDKIHETICKMTLDKEIEANNQRFTAFGDELLAHLVKTSFGDWGSRMEEAPEGMFPEVKTIHVRCVEGETIKVPLSEERRVPYRLTNDAAWRRPFQLKDSDLSRRALDAARLHFETGKELSKKATDLHVALNNFRTWKQLRETWPALYESLPNDIKALEHKANLPAVPIGKLNEALGLPVDAKKKAAA